MRGCPVSLFLFIIIYLLGDITRHVHSFFALRMHNFRLKLPDSGETYKLSMNIRLRGIGKNGQSSKMDTVFNPIVFFPQVCDCIDWRNNKEPCNDEVVQYLQARRTGAMQNSKHSQQNDIFRREPSTSSMWAP